MQGGAKKISILGVTGSVGESTMDVVLSSPDQFDVQAVSAHRNVDLLAERAVKLGAKQAVIADEGFYAALKDRLNGSGIEALAGDETVCEVAAQPDLDMVMAAIVGMAGLDPIVVAIAQGTDIAIANKEPLVSAGALVMAAARESGSRILPVDSEHNAIFQVFEPENKSAIERLVITASGGPFRDWSYAQMQEATKAQALKHPNWSMGAKITIDSATMMNKALEVIEAHYLFDMPADKIDVLVHPQSVVHSMVEYNDGSLLAQLGASDMRTPVANALAYPARISTPGQRLDLTKMSQLTFEAPDQERFPALRLAYECLESGAAHCISFNAANEIAVAAFLEERIGFTDIVDIVSRVLDNSEDCDVNSLADIKELDQTVRQQTQQIIERL